MGEFVSELFRDNAYVVSIVTMIIGILASYVFALPKRWVKITGNIILAVGLDLFTIFYYKTTATTVVTIVLSIIWVVIFIILSKNKELITRKKLDSMIRKFTEKTEYSAPLCIFGGDLDFFGDVASKLTAKQQKKGYRNNSITQCNKQYLQLKDMKFRNIQILSLKPVEKEAKVRIGFLKEQFGEALTIKFIEEKECSTCDNQDSCLVCDVCNKCPQNKGCLRKNVHSCSKLMEHYQYRCYNPDTKLRGRIAKLKDTGSTTVAIVTTHTSGKSYILKEYSSDTKECTIYQNIWDVWWKKCKEDKKIIGDCITEYNKHKKSGKK